MQARVQRQIAGAAYCRPCGSRFGWATGWKDGSLSSVAALIVWPWTGWFSRRSRASGVSAEHWRSDAAPLRAIGDDDEQRPTFTDLYHSRRLNLVRLAIFLVDDLHTAEDVVQDAFAAVYRRHGADLSDLDTAGAYLHTAVVNAARSVLRRRQTARAYVPPEPGYGPPAEEHVLLAEEHRQVIDALQRLTARQREVLVLRYWSDLSEVQIAETLGLSRGTVKSTASRALDALEKMLEGQR